MMATRDKYWLLDSVAGWQLASSTGIQLTVGEGDITLDSLPGNAEFLGSALASNLKCPVALAADAKGRVFVLDSSNCRISILDLSTQRVEIISAIGGPGTSLRHLHFPRALTVLPSGSVAIADTGNRRVQLFSAAPFVLLHVWGAPEDMKPCAVASDHCGIVYIADHVKRAILRIRATGEWLEPIGAGVLQEPVAVAAGPQQEVAVVDGRGANATIVIFPANSEQHIRLSLAKSPLSLSFDDSGNLYVGTANALISKLEPDSSAPHGWSLGGDGVSDSDGGVTSVAWTKTHGLLAILTNTTPNSAGIIEPPKLFSMDPTAAFRLTGSFLTKPLDSNIETCPWHRAQICGTVPANSSLFVESSTSESTTSGWTPYVPCGTLTGNNPDCLIQSVAGRYLQLRLALYSDGTVSPRLHSLSIHFPRQSYLQYLPAIFQDDPQSRSFLDRFLSVFQTTFDGLDNKLDNLWQIFDPLVTPDTFLPWLAAWIAFPLDPTASPAVQRQLLKNAFAAYTARGTVAGLQKMIQDWTSVQNIRILEHFRLRNWTFLPFSSGLNEGNRLWSRNFYARLQVGVNSQIGAFRLPNSPQPAADPYDWGANQFSVLFPANPYTVSDTSAEIQKILNREKPAYTESFLCPIYPRLRVGVQATLGIDAYVGEVKEMILGRLATLNYDSVLATSQTARDTQSLGLSRYPRLGADARVL
jgi:phage tail-like protein